MDDNSGLAAVRRAIAAGGFGRGIGRTLRMRGIAAEPGQVTLGGSPDRDFYNPQDSVHGGYIATMLDSAMALAVLTRLDPTSGYATTGLNVSYLRPLTEEIGEVRATGTVIELAGRRAVAEASLRDADGVLYAHATATFGLRAGYKPGSPA